MPCAGLVLALGLALSSPQTDPADVALRDAWAKVQTGELLEALERVRGLPGDAARFELEAEALYLGRRFQAARGAARQGLAEDPRQARLALRALQASLWLADPRSARDDWTALERAITDGVEPEHRAAWEDLLHQHGGEIEKLEQRDRTFAKAERRVRTMVAALGPLSLGLLAWALVGSLAAGKAPRR